jgi:hypothetical protein
MAPREELPYAQKRFIVERLACFDGPTAVAKAVKEAFGLELSKQRIGYYDPTTAAGAALDQTLKDLFTTTRERFRASLTDIPIANQAVRLRSLQKQLDLYDGMKAAGIVTSLCEAAAKEMGGAFTNRKELSGPGGAPIATEDKTPRQTPEQVRDELVALLGPAAAGTDAPAPPANADRDVPVVRAEADSGSSGQPGAPAPAQAVAGPERSVLFADGDLQEE